MKIRQLVETSNGNDIDISDKKLTKLPSDLQDVIPRNFQCNDNNLTTLEGSPSQVGGDFTCNSNQLTTLEGCPSQVGGNFLCYDNRLTSLEGCPSQVGGNFYCQNNQVSSLKDIHIQITKIGGSFYCLGNPIKSHILGLMMIEINGVIQTELGDGHDVDRILNKWKNQGRRGVMGAMKELTDLGYEELAQL